MAEILGAVASGLAVAEVGLKVGGTVWKLKKLWQQLDEVPETIQDLMKHIEIMDPVLSDYETILSVQSAGLPEQLPTHPSSTTMLSTAYCREALDDLRDLVKDLDSAIQSEKRSRRTFARVRVVLKKDTIQGFQDRMDKAIKLLQCTQVNYLVANAMMTGAMVADMWTAVAGTQQQVGINNSPNSAGKPPFPTFSQPFDVSREKGPVKENRSWLQASRIALPEPRLCLFGALIYDQSKTEIGDDATYAVRFQLPKWISHKVWDIIINRACFGWQASLFTWNIVPSDSPGFVCVSKGDLDGLIDLFKRGLASPKDRDSNGHTMLSLASKGSHAHVVQYLCDANLDQPCIEALNLWWGLFILSSQLPMDLQQQLVSRGLIKRMADTAEDLQLPSGPMTETPDLDHLFSIHFTMYTSHLPEVFELCFRTVFPFWHSLPPKRKQWILMMECKWKDQYWATISLRIWILTGFPTWTADALRLMLSSDRNVRAIDVQAWIDDGASILHQVLVYFLRSESSTADQDWKILLKEIIEAVEDVHHRLQVPNLKFLGTCSALEFALLSVLRRVLMSGPILLDGKGFKWTTRRLLKQTMVKLQVVMSTIASCGYDLLEFGRREAKTWLVEGYPGRNRNVGDTLYLGIGDPRGRGLYVRAVHYGADPKDWYFETDFHYEDYAGDFWNLLENPHLFMMPGAWMDEE